jgi:hypothetical protein
MQIQDAMNLTLATAKFDEILHLIDAAGVSIFMRHLRLPFCWEGSNQQALESKQFDFLIQPPRIARE